MCSGSKLLLANRMARLFVVAYLVLLHLFVVAMLYIWSASGGSSAEIDVAALAPLMAPSAQARVSATRVEGGKGCRQLMLAPSHLQADWRRARLLWHNEHLALQHLATSKLSSNFVRPLSGAVLCLLLKQSKSRFLQVSDACPHGACAGRYGERKQRS